MSLEVETAAQAQVLIIATDLEAILNRLRRIHDSLPVAPEEGLMLLGEAKIDVSTEVRAAIECVLRDSIEPAIRSLKAAASFQPAAVPKE
jgi:hypothetical protein